MPRIRYLKPEFFTDEDLGELSFQTRLTYQGLWCYADKEGRLEDRPKFLKAMIFPYDDVDIEVELELLSQFKSNGSPFIQRYVNGNGKYIQIIQWEKHQKPHHTEKESIFPPPQTPPKIKIKIKGMGSVHEASTELKNGELTVKKRLEKDFALFYNTYPKKRKKGDAEKAFKKLNPNQELLLLLLNAIEQAKKSEEWQEQNGKFIPFPATWLRAKGWEDELNPDQSNPAQKQRMWKDVKKDIENGR
jgi:hypothetical protein